MTAYRDALVASALGELTPLQQRILSAYEGGRYDELRRLQSEFRRTAVSSSASRYGSAPPVRLVEPRTTSTRRRRSTVEEKITTKTPPTTEHIELHEDAAPRLRVRLLPGARRAISDECWRDRGNLNLQFETGGWMISLRPHRSFRPRGRDRPRHHRARAERQARLSRP